MASVFSFLFAPPRLILRALDDLHRIADAAEDMETSIKPLEDDIDGLRRAFEGSNEELAKIREAFTPQLAALHAELLSLRAQVGSEIAGIDRNLTEVAETVEPLQGAAERVGRAVERLPGPGRRKSS
jgi:archaellum component FlaC